MLLNSSFFCHKILLTIFFSQLVVDSMGKLPPGVMDGNTNWLGSYSECTNVTVNYTDIKTRWKYFTGRYCDVKVAMANSVRFSFAK